jgi:parvulin-like peptidyl-prolyl isomerase
LGWSQQPTAAQEQKPPQPDQRVVISVDDEKMTSADVERFVQSLPPQFRAYYGGPAKHLLPQYLVQLKILAAQARKEKLEDQPEVKESIEIARNSILADAAKRRLEQSIPVSEAQLKEEYEKQKASLTEVRIRRLLIRTSEAAVPPAAAPSRPPLPEAEARKKLEDLRKQILAGEDFAELARANSEDLATAGSGGDMGYVNRQTVVPPIANAAYALSPGQVSEIFGTPYGLELIKLEDKRVKPLAEVRPQLEAQIRQGQLQEMLQKLVSQHQVSVDQTYFTPPKKTSQ